MGTVLTNVILVVHILIALALTGVVLLQRSEGGALGMGGGGAGGGLMSGRGVAGALVRTTMIFAAGFFITSLTLTTIANRSREATSAVETEQGDRLDENAPQIVRPLEVTPDAAPVETPPPAGPVDLDEPAVEAAPADAGTETGTGADAPAEPGNAQPGR